MAKRPWIGTSWKMNKTFAEADEFCRVVGASELTSCEKAQLFVIPSFTAIARVSDAIGGTGILIGAQNVHWEDAGAWTGEVSPVQVKDAGAKLVEIGHSERREFFNETDESVSLKAAAAVRHGLAVLICIGDTRDEFEARRTGEVLKRQTEIALSRIDWSQDEPNIVIAYEPVWSIGERGTPAEPGFVDERHAEIREVLRSAIGRTLPVLYGGSVNEKNCVDLGTRPNIDGLFIGRSAWNAEGYLRIVSSVIDALS